ncbi:MAG: ribonuclease HI [Betaproteobacteria bacterium]|nr:ribonuclease HI [Betaproteobacteria bacterium]
MPAVNSVSVLAGQTTTATVDLYTDGACKGNPGPGGWGVLMRFGAHERELYGGEAQTTNNRMEMRAVIEGLNALNRSCQVRIFTDSQYVKNGIESWLAAWKTKGWKTAAGKPVANQDLWEALDAARSRHQIDWHWVRGHAGHPENERADGLANRGVEQVLRSKG